MANVLARGGAEALSSLSTMLVLGTFVCPDGRSGRTAVAIGAVIATVAMSKINVGVLLLLPTLLALLTVAPEGRTRSLLLWSISSAALLIPTVMIANHGHWSLPLVVISSLVAVAVVSHRAPIQRFVMPGDIAWLIVTLLLITGAWMVATLWHGTSLTGLLDGLFFQHVWHK